MINRLTITEAASMLGISPRTIVRWENKGKVKKARRDWRGWRVYDENELDSLKHYHDIIVELV